MLCQTSEAIVFCKQHPEEIFQLNAKILAAGARFLAAFGEKHLPKEVVAHATNAISAQSVVGMAGTLRAYAANFAHPVSECYWSLIDAAYFLSDATGSRWPYMTPERRHSALQFASEGIESFNASFEQLPKEPQ